MVFNKRTHCITLHLRHTAEDSTLSGKKWSVYKPWVVPGDLVRMRMNMKHVEARVHMFSHLPWWPTPYSPANMQMHYGYSVPARTLICWERKHDCALYTPLWLLGMATNDQEYYVVIRYRSCSGFVSIAAVASIPPPKNCSVILWASFNPYNPDFKKIGLIIYIKESRLDLVKYCVHVIQ